MKSMYELVSTVYIHIYIYIYTKQTHPVKKNSIKSILFPFNIMCVPSSGLGSICKYKDSGFQLWKCISFIITILFCLLLFVFWVVVSFYPLETNEII